MKLFCPKRNIGTLLVISETNTFRPCRYWFLTEACAFTFMG